MTTELPTFESSLKYAKVRDFAYHKSHPLHYGVKPDLPPTKEAAGVDDTAYNGPSNQVSQPRNRPDDIYRRAVALFDFEPENDNEIQLIEGQIVWISYRHGQGWLVAEHLETGQTGLVPEEYVQVQPDDSSEWLDEQQ